MSRILHLVNMGLRDGRSKGVREHRLEELPLCSLAAPCHLEESASHHYYNLGHSLLQMEGVRSTLLQVKHVKIHEKS